MKALLEFGADVSARRFSISLGSSARTALGLAIAGGHAEVVSVLLSMAPTRRACAAASSWAEDPLNLAVASGQYSIVTRLLKKGRAPNRQRGAYGG